MLKSGVKPIKEAYRVTLKRAKGVLFVIQPADVYKGGDAYVVFGEARAEDLAAQAQTGAAEQFRVPQGAADPYAALANSVISKSEGETSKEDEIPPLEAEANEADLAALNVQEKDIELVMAQGKVSRAKAVSLLKQNDGDVVNTLMQLSQ